MFVSRTTRAWFWTLSVCLLSAVGCARIRLPAIDPSGERIFLPAPASTTFALPGLPSPAFRDVPVPPPCGTAPANVAVAPDRPAGVHGLMGHRHDGNLIPGRLQLSPTRLIAPIGSEVVLVSGLCGDDGYLVTKQPIEFNLSEDSVGQLVDVADDDRALAKCFARKKGGKFSNDYAIGFGAQADQLITRGTPQPNDDVRVQRGQTWVSLTSASEGTSYVTVLAPNALNWDRRLQTATVHWVDAQWTFPAPSLAPAGQGAKLLTTVKRSDGNPLNNAWLVRYEVLGGTPATFGTRGETAIEVPTDPQGLAGVELVSANADPGATQIRIQVIRPQSDGTPRLVVGEGYTSVTWRAAGLTVQLAGPTTLLVGAPATYRATITNPGDIVSRNVVVTCNLPPRITFVSSNQRSERIGDGIQWRLGDLAPQATQVLEMQFRADHPGSLTLFVEAQSQEGRKARASTATDILAPTLSVRVQPNQDNIEVGGQVIFQAEVTNNGDRPLRNIELISRFDEGLAHVSGQRSPLTNRLETLNAGETVDVPVTFNVRRPGALCYVLEAAGPNSQRASARACINATAAAARPKLEARISGPNRRVVGEIAEVSLEVTNSGNVPLSNIRLAAAYDESSLQPFQADADFQQAPGEFFWVVPGLRPGDTASRRVHFRCLQPAGALLIKVTAASGTVSGGETSLSMSISPPSTPAPRPRDPDTDSGPAAPPRANSGDLRIQIEAPDAIQVGEQRVVTISVTNARGASDRNVDLSFLIPNGLEFRGLRGGRPLSDRREAEGVNVSVERVNEMRANETITYELTVVGRTPGTQRLAASGRSQLATAGVTAERQIVVNRP